jgi:hypothetical protein
MRDGTMLTASNLQAASKKRAAWAECEERRDCYPVQYGIVTDCGAPQ